MTLYTDDVICVGLLLTTSTVDRKKGGSFPSHTQYLHLPVLFSGALLVYIQCPIGDLGSFWHCYSEGSLGWEKVVQLSGSVKASLGPSVLVQVFFRSWVGLEEVEGNMGQNSLLTSISCRWGAQGSWGGVEGRSPCWYNTSTKQVCLDGWA